MVDAACVERYDAGHRLSDAVCCACNGRRLRNALVVQQLVLGCVLVLVLVVYTVPLWPLSLFARAMCGVMVFIAYLIVDTYRLVHDSTMHGGDPLLCTMELYVDVVNAFVFVVDALIHDSTE